MKPSRGYTDESERVSELPKPSTAPQVRVVGTGVVGLVGGGSMVVIDGVFRGINVIIPLDDDDCQAIAELTEYRRSLMS